MRKALLIALREYKAAVKTKSFVVGLVLMPIMMGGGFLAQALFRNQVDMQPKHFAIIDRSPGQHLFALLDKAAKLTDEKQPTALGPRAPFVLEAVPVASERDLGDVRLALSERVRKGDLTGFLEISSQVLDAKENDAKKAGAAKPQAGLRYQTNRPSYQDFSKWAETIINGAAQAKRAAQHGIDGGELRAIVAPVPIVTKGLSTRDPVTGAIVEPREQNPIVAFLLPGGFIILMFMMVLLGAAPLLNGVMEEKLQRIAEVLLGSVPPFTLMMGKIIGMACVSLTMTAIYLAGIFWAVHHYGYGEFLSADIIAWFLVFQVLALFMFGSLYAAVGAACSDIKEAQSMLLPITFASMIPLFIWINIVKEPMSTFSTAASFFPLFTPMLMVARQAVPPGIPWWQPILGVIVVLAFTTLCVYAAGRIFRVGILMQGKGPGVRDLLRWVLRG